ncbi:BAR domain-containing protein [Caenorhabditis elegans]|uniref:BAR domain-containing protein n=1 Tax=Caenorhabditis elegans TaxID=6239 RepID=Q9XW43_CAEEL|nr:BAR domain-containing protein [Caenorhabditis elegans]CAA22251.1 BAR domain-containing protein [Caenorhabditis elegans]|eukprot:NP_492435.1 Uncharacterized protein CELE_W06D4.3 [Caenorhabditis elegans]
MDKKANSNQNQEQKRETSDAVDRAAKAGLFNRIYVTVGQKVGIVELTKLEPRFERNIEKLTTYHNIIYNMVNAIELQVQVDPKAIVKNQVLCDPDESPWELLGGWINYMGTYHFNGPQSKILDAYSIACGKIGQKERQLQKRTRSHCIKKMRMYTADESVELNNHVAHLKDLLIAIDDSRHQLKSSRTTKEVKAKGEIYRKNIQAFNCTANEVQARLDEVPMIVPHHENELLKFSREVSIFNNSVENLLKEVVFRLGYGKRNDKPSTRAVLK